MWRDPLAPQGGPLDDAKAVLLVYNDETQVLERDVFLDQRMGSDDNVGFARSESRIHLSALHASQAPGEQHNRDGPAKAPIFSRGQQF